MTYVKNNLRGVIDPNFGIAKADIDASNLTTARSYILPDSSGQIALSSHSHSYSNLTDKPTIGTAANNLVQLDSNAKLPAVDGSQLTNQIDQIARDSATAAKRIALTAIAMSKSTGGQWGTVFGDEFTDETRISSNTGATFTTGYYHNPASSGGNLASGKTAISGGDYSGYPASNVNDNVTSNSWISSQVGSAVANAAYIGIDLASNKDVVKVGLWFDLQARTPSSAKIQYSDNGSAWSDAATISPQGVYGQFAYFTFASVGSHRYWRFLATSGVSSNEAMWIHEMSLFEEDTPSPNMTLISTAVTETRSGTVKSMLIGLEYEPIDTVTLGTDLKLYASRDNGTTWTEATYDPATPFLSGKILVTALADTSGQAAGSNLKWKLTSHNNRQVKIHGVTVYPSME